ncbi:MAG: SulP family inorganic anion transporter [Sphingomonas sp.]
MQRADIVAGISIAGLLLPEAVAYSGIAGLPPQHALVAAIAGCLAYALIGRSRFAIVSPTSSSAAILAASLGALAGPPELRILLATVTVGMVGLMFFAAGVARLGGLTGFVSRPVLRGFAFGLAITIILKQLPLLVGIDLHEADIFRLTLGLVAGIAQWNPVTLVVGMTALAILLALRRFPMLPGGLVVLAGGVALSMLLDLPSHGVAVVGRINVWPSLPHLAPIPWRTLSHLAELALPLVLILFAESWGTMRALALRHGDTLNPNRELSALGVANLASALVQGMPVGAGFSAGSASEAAGAASRAAGVFAAIGLAALMLLAAPLVAHLPQAVLAAVVMAALGHALDPAPLIRLWRLGKDQYVALAAAVGVLALGILNGMLFAILLSVAALIRKMAAPDFVRLGRLGDSHDFVDLARHPDAVEIRGVAIWRPMEPLFFANAERVLALIADRQAAEPEVKTVVVSLEQTFDLDSTALDALIEFDARLKMRGIMLLLARARDPVRDVLAAGGAGDLVARSSYSVEDSIARLAAKSLPGQD